MIIKKIKSSYFVKTFNLFKKNIDNLFLIFIFDIWFLAAIAVSARIAEFLGKSLFEQPLQFYSITPMIIFAIGYCAIIILIYSFFKYFVLNYLKRMFKKTKIDLKRFGSFFLLNLIIAVSLFVIFIALNGMLLLNVKREVAPYIFLLISIPFIFFFYAIINIAHSLFIDLTNIKDILRKTIKITFTNIKSYAGIYLSSIIIFVIYYLIYYLINSILKNTMSSIFYYSIYLNIFMILTGIIFYIVIFFNRVYFYLIIKEKFLKSIRK